MAPDHLRQVRNNRTYHKFQQPWTVARESTNRDYLPWMLTSLGEQGYRVNRCSGRSTSTLLVLLVSLWGPSSYD